MKKSAIYSISEQNTKKKKSLRVILILSFFAVGFFCCLIMHKLINDIIEEYSHLFISRDVSEELIFTINRILIIVQLVLDVMIIGIAYLLSDAILRPFTKLSQNLRDIKSEYKDEIHEDGGYAEFEEVVDAFNDVMGRLNDENDKRQAFVSNVSHELKTPITSMKILAESLLQNDNADIALYREFMSDIISEMDRQNQLITDLLSLVKIDSNEGGYDVVSTSLNYLIEGVIERVKPFAAEKNVSLEVKIHDNIWAQVDAVKMSLVISNLIENAIKYNRPNGYVIIELSLEEEEFALSVADSGIGIPQDSLDKIYDRFYRVDKSHSRNIGGTGLGLSIVKSAVLFHHGRILVNSKLGEGTTFKVNIPLAYSEE